MVEILWASEASGTQASSAKRCCGESRFPILVYCPWNLDSPQCTDLPSAIGSTWPRSRIVR